jgi:hypothetical protein
LRERDSIIDGFQAKCVEDVVIIDCLGLKNLWGFGGFLGLGGGHGGLQQAVTGGLKKPAKMLKIELNAVFSFLTQFFLKKLKLY